MAYARPWPRPHWHRASRSPATARASAIRPYSHPGPQWFNRTGLYGYTPAFNRRAQDGKAHDCCRGVSHTPSGRGGGVMYASGVARRQRGRMAIRPYIARRVILGRPKHDCNFGLLIDVCQKAPRFSPSLVGHLTLRFWSARPKSHSKARSSKKRTISSIASALAKLKSVGGGPDRDVQQGVSLTTSMAERNVCCLNCVARSFSKSAALPKSPSSSACPYCLLRFAVVWALWIKVALECIH